MTTTNLISGFAAVVLLLSACSSQESPTDEPSAVASPEVAETPTPPPVPESDQCRAAAGRWVDRIDQHLSAVSTTAPQGGKQLELKNLGGPVNTIKGQCSGPLIQNVQKSMTLMINANYELELCPEAGPCDEAATAALEKRADRVADLVDVVRASL